MRGWMHNHSTTGTYAGKWHGINRDFLAFVSGWGLTCDPGTGRGLVSGGGGGAPIRSPWPPFFPEVGGRGAKACRPVSWLPTGGQPTACTLASWWLKFGPTKCWTSWGWEGWWWWWGVGVGG